MSVLNLRQLVENIVEQELAEMPVASYKTVGDFSKRSSISHPVDRKLLTHPKAIEKIKRQWEKTPFDFDLFVVNDKRAKAFQEIGSVDFYDYVRTKMNLSPEEVPEYDPDHITILFTNNSGDERFMASGWILAHRFGHALNRSTDKSGVEWRRFTARLSDVVKSIATDVYGLNVEDSRYGFEGEKTGKMLKYLAQQLGSMKSARDSNLRSWYEFAYELLAQYMLTGNIKLNPLPDRAIVGLGGWGRKDTRGADQRVQTMYNNHDLEYYASELETMLDSVLSAAVGKTYIM